MKKIISIGLVSGLIAIGLAFLLVDKEKKKDFLTQAQQWLKPQKQASQKSIVDQVYPAPYGGEKGKITLRNLDLSRVPGEQELRRAGQLGSPLTPTGPAEPKSIKNSTQRKRQEQDNLLFAKAMDLWNRHKYTEAVQLFKQHRAEFPESPWAAESELHMGCEAQFNGRWDEAEFNFEWILKQAAKGTDMYQKAKLRRSVLAMEQGQVQMAIDSFKEMLKTEKNWERRTYAQTWIRQLSLWKNFQAALRNCGSESIAHLCEIQGQAEKAEKLRQRPAKGDHGFTISELMTVAKEAGFKPKAIRADGQELDKIATPFIAHYRDLHYVVVKDISPETEEVKIYDPRLKHETKLPWDNFLRQWSGLGIVFNEEIAKEIRLASVEDLHQVGGCCGIPRPEDDLGDEDDEEDEDCGKGLPTWRVNRINFNVLVRDIPLWYDNNIGPNVRIILTYNSQDSINQLRPFGNKWMFNYASYAMEGPGGTVTIVMPHGRRDTYTPNGPNTYSPPKNRPNYQLTKVGEYAYELKLPNRNVYRYAVPEVLEGESTTSLLVEVRDPFGQKITLDHNAQGALTKIKDALGREATFQYDENDDLTGQTDMGGVSYSYAYDSDSYLSSITLPSGKTKFYIEAAETGNAIQASYPSSGQQANQGGQNYPAPGAAMWENYRVTITDPLGFKEEYYFDGEGGYGWYRNKKQCLSNLPALQAPKTRFFYTLVEGKGAFSSVEYADGSEEFFSDYTSHKKPQTFQDRNGNTQSYTYNSKKKILTHTDARGNVTTFSYAENKQDLTQVVNALDQTVLELAYGDEGQVTSITDADQHKTFYGYNEFGNLVSTTNALGEVTIYERNGLQQITAIKKGNATLQTFTYDPIGRVQTVTDSLGNTKAYDYNGLNRITKVTFSDGTTIENQWSCCRLESQTDRAGHTTYFSYNAVGKLLTQTDAQNRITQFFYDPNGNLIKLIDPKGNQTRWEYDALDRVVKRIYADNSELNYSFDKVGNLIKFTNARNQTIHYAYDKTYNLTTLNGADLASVAWVYDKLNRVTQMNDALGATTYGYDTAGRLKSIDGPWDNDTITYSYDALNRATQRTIASSSISVVYDELGRIDSKTDGLGVFQYDYNGVSSQIKEITYPNAQKTLFNYYDPNGSSRLKEIVNQDSLQQNLSQFTYHYDFGGNIVQWDRQLGDSPQVYNFDYDQVDQLKSAILKDPNTQTALKKSFYSYDAVGNRISAQENYNPVEGSFNKLNQLNQLQAGGSILFQGDVNEPALVKVNNLPAKTVGSQFERSVKIQPGTNVITITAQDAQNNIRTNIYQVLVTNEVNTTFVYDLDGNLTMTSNQQSVVTYEWDALSRLLKIHQPDRETQFAYDGLGRWVGITEKENNVTISDKRFLWAGNALAQERSANNEITKRFYSSGVQLANQQKYYYTRDHLGSIREVTDENGTVQARYDYDPYGHRTKLTGNFEADFGFTGHYFHQPSGLHLTRFRAYDANYARWLSRDPIGELGGINLYGYVGGNPINYYDPLGLNPLLIVAGGAIIISEEAVIVGAAVTIFAGTVYIIEQGIDSAFWILDKILNGEQCSKASKPSSPGKMQREVERGWAPREIDRVDNGHPGSPEPHVHYKNGTSSKQNGEVHDKHKGIPNPSRETREWLEKHGWTAPPK
jgi:RHS repeat-associated protein